MGRMGLVVFPLSFWHPTNPDVVLPEERGKIKVVFRGPGEMAWRLKALIALPSKGPKFKSQQPHCDSLLSIMGSDALFWSV